MSVVLITGSTGLVGSEAVNFFCEKGFDVVDRQLVAALKGNQDYTQALGGDVTAASRIANQLGAEVIVLGTAKISSGGKFYNMYSGQADINGRIVKETATNSVTNYNLNISDLNSGIYFMKIKTAEGILDKKIIKN